MSSDLQAATKSRKSSSVPSSGCTASWPPSAAADGIGAAGIAVGRGHRVVAALAVGVADRMDRREIDHVKAHRRDIRQPRDAILEGAVLAGRLALAARHHLVPGAGRARGRSATSGNSGDRVRSGRNWLSAIASFNSSVSSGAASPVCRKSSHCRRITAAAACPPACALVSMPAPSIASRVGRRRPSA